MKIHRDVIAGATDEQLLALRDNVLKHWEAIKDGDIEVVREWGKEGDSLLVYLRRDDAAFLVIGIEPDGYTHS